MVESRAELKAKGVFATASEAPSGHASKQLGQLVCSLFHEISRVQDASCVIELCSRDFEMSRYLPMEGCEYYGVDLAEPSAEPFADAPGEGELRSLELSISKSRFIPIKGDVFGPRTLKALPKKDGSAQLVYCRPPAQKAISQSLETVEAAKKLLAPYVSRRAERLRAAHPEMTFEDLGDLSLYESYFVFAAAALIDECPKSTAIIQVPTRVLNLARARKDRKLLLEQGLLDSVVLLPEGIAPGREEEALLCLTDGEPGRPVFTFDARPFGGARLDCERMERLVANLQAARAEGTGEGVHWSHPLNDSEGIFSLMPDNGSSTFPPSAYVPFGKIAKINRGISRAAITKLPETKAKEDYYPQDHYYLSPRPLTDGCIASANEVVSAGIVSEADIYDLGWVAEDSLGGIKTLDTRVSNLLIARVGPPFKLALVTHGETQTDSEGKPEPELLDRFIVPSDNLFFAAIEDETLAIFLLAYLSSEEGQNELACIAHGATLSQISPKDLRAMRVPVPSREEQERLANAYKTKQRAYENALEASERHAKSKRTLM